MKNKEVRSIAREIIDSIENILRSKKDSFRGFSSEFKRVNVRELTNMISKLK